MSKPRPYTLGEKMRRNAATIVILICIGSSWLAAQGHEGMSQQAPQAQQTVPAQSSMPQQMPGMPPNQPASQSLEEAGKRPAMSLKDFEGLALANNPTLRQANDSVARSAAQAQQAGLYPNPSVGYEGNEIRGGSFGGGEQGAFVQQTIVLGGKLGLRRRVFQAEQQEDQTGVAVQRYRLLGDVDQRFYAALADQQIVNLRARLLRITLDAVETAHQLANVGQADLPDVLQAEVEAGEARVDYTTAEMNYIQAFNTLAATAGKPNLPLSPLQGNLAAFPQLNPQQIIETVLRDSPEVKRAQEAVSRAEAQLRSDRRERIPNLTLRAGVQQDNEALNEAAVRQKPVGVIGFASVGVDVPIFNRNQGNVAAASAELESARDEVTRIELSLRRTAEPLLREYLAGEVEASRYKSDMIPKATRAYHLYLNKYRQMAAAYPEVLVSQRTWFNLEVSYVQTLEHLWENAIALQKFTLTNGLEVPPASGSPSIKINLPNVQATSSGGE